MGLRRRPIALAVALAVAAPLAVGVEGGGPAPGESKRALVELGRRLFFDPAVSPSGTRSCADCHDPEHGYSDPRERSRDVRGLTPNHAQTLIDCADATSYHWHGEFPTIADVVEARMLEGTTPDGRSRAYGGRAARPPPPPPPPDLPPSLRARETPPSPVLALEPALVAPSVVLESLPRPEAALLSAGRHRELLAAAFSGEPPRTWLAEAIEAYCVTVRSGASPYDRFAAGDSRAISSAARSGLALFQGPAGCAACHSTRGPRAPFTDGLLHDLGPIRSEPFSLPPAQDAPLATPDVTLKTPSLRDVARRGPFLHDGSAATLADAVRRFLPRDSTPSEVGDLVAFLESLTSDVRPGLPAGPSKWRAKRTRLRLLDADGEPLARFAFDLATAGDPLGPREHPRVLSLVTDEKGVAQYEPPPWTHVRVVLEGGVRPFGGPMVPDTCREATLRLPLRGTTQVEVRFPGDEAAEEIVARHVEARFLPDGVLPTTVFRRTLLTRGRDGATALYAGRVRTDAGRQVALDLGTGYAPGHVFLGGPTFVARHRAEPAKARR
jgi:cytochrome c peroxidase